MWIITYLEGRLSSRTYQTQAGETRFSNDINVTEVQFLGQRGGQGQASEAPIGSCFLGRGQS